MNGIVRFFKRSILPLIAFFMAASLVLAVNSCVQDEESSDLAQVKYTVIVSDSVSAEAIEGAKVLVTWDDFSEETYTTNANGMVTLPPVASFTNQFIITASDFRTLDTVDLVNRPQDSLQTNLLRVLNLLMVPDSLPVQDQIQNGGWVRYTIVVQDKYTGSPVSDATVSLTASDLSVKSQTTDEVGRAVVDSVFSVSNQIGISAPGYQTKDTLDQILTPLDSGSVFRIINVQLDTLG